MPVSNPAHVAMPYTEVATYADLPDAVEFVDKNFVILASTGIWGINRKRAGMWRSDGETWRRLGELTGSGGVIFSVPPDGKKRVNNVYYDPELGKYAFEREE